MSRAGGFAVVGLMWLVLGLLPSSAVANPIFFDEQRDAAVVATKAGGIEYWPRNATAPLWSIALPGSGSRYGPAVLALAEFGSGQLVVVRRYGDIHLINLSDGEVLQNRVLQFGPFYVAAQSALFGGPDAYQFLEGISAAHIAGGELTVSSFAPQTEYSHPKVYAIPLTRLFSTPSDVVPFFYDSEGFRVVALDTGAATWRGMEGDPPDFRLRFFDEGRDEITNSARCGSVDVFGTKAGAIIFVGDDEEDLTVRVLDGPEPSPIWDVGCVGADFAFSVTLGSAYGEVQLWKLSSRAMVHHIDDEAGKSLGSSFGVGAGSQLLTIGQLSNRLWRLQDGQLTLVSVFSGQSTAATRAAGVTANNSILLYDDRTIWLIDTAGIRTPFAGARSNPR